MFILKPASNSSPKLRSTSSSVALPGLVQAELLSVLAERHYGGTQPGPGRRHKKTARGKAGSEGCVWEEEDLGLPASLGESPGDLTRSTSRHHSSCSDNSLLSLDRIISDTGEAMDRDSGAESLASLGQGQEPVSSGVLSHSAARHKMAIRPKRNHVVRRHRQLHQLTEVLVTLDVKLLSCLYTFRNRKDKIISPSANQIVMKSLFPEMSGTDQKAWIRCFKVTTVLL